MSDQDVPSPIDFHDPIQAREWESRTIENRPWRPRFFAAFVATLDSHFHREFSVLELGSGPGHLAEQILGQCRVTRYVALDFSKAMNALARARLARCLDKIEFLERDFRVQDWNVGLGAFDLVVTMQAAHEVRHIRHLPALLARARQSLTRGGLLLYCDHYAEAGSTKHVDLHLRREDQPVLLRNANFAEVRKVLDVGGMALYSALNPG